MKYKGTLFPVHHGDALLGRSPECLIVLASERVSREHAVVRRIHCGLEIEDLGSRNGTWVNGSRIRRATVLSPGDEVRLGEDVLEVVLEQNAQVPVTVSGVASSVAQEAHRQREVLHRIEDVVARLGPADDYGVTAYQLRSFIDEFMDGLGEWGLLLSDEERRRLSQVIFAMSGWVGSGAFERWSVAAVERLEHRAASRA